MIRTTAGSAIAFSEPERFGPLKGGGLEAARRLQHEAAPVP
jgi:hypothetical protein